MNAPILAGLNVPMSTGMGLGLYVGGVWKFRFSSLCSDRYWLSAWSIGGSSTAAPSGLVHSDGGFVT